MEKSNKNIITVASSEIIKIHRLFSQTNFELKEAEARAHLLEGLKIALDNIDEVINIIRGSKNPTLAKEGLMNSFNLSEVQAQAILEMRLQ